MRYFPFYRPPAVRLLALGVIFVLLLGACGSTSSSSGTLTSTPTAAAKGTVAVAYAASLSNILENSVKSAFDSSTGYTF